MTAAASNLQRISRMLHKQLNLDDLILKCWLYTLSTSAALV